MVLSLSEVSVGYWWGPLIIRIQSRGEVLPNTKYLRKVEEFK